MDNLVWVVTGSLLGWAGYSMLRFNEERGRLVSMALGAAGALIGAKAIAPLFIVMPEEALNVPGMLFAGMAAVATLALGNLLYTRWGI